MSEQAPSTLEEWMAYWENLSGAELRMQAVAANSPLFVRTLQQEGFAAQDIHAIIRALACRFSKDGELPPGGGFYDLQSMAKQAERN